VVIRERGKDLFIKLAFAWQYENKCEALVLVETEAACPSILPV